MNDLPPGSLQSTRTIDGQIPVGIVALLSAKGCTLTEIGRAFDVTRERIRQIATRAGVPRQLGRHTKTEQHAQTRLHPGCHRLMAKLTAVGWTDFHTARSTYKDKPLRNRLLAHGQSFRYRVARCAAHTDLRYPTNRYYRLTVQTPYDWIAFETPIGWYVVPWHVAKTARMHYASAERTGHAGLDPYYEAWPSPPPSPTADTFAAWCDLYVAVHPATSD